MRSASGSPAQYATRSSAASGSAVIRACPAAEASSSSAPSSSSGDSATEYAPATRASWVRQVTSTVVSVEPGSRGPTWRSPAALSSRSSIRLPAVRVR